MGLHAKGVWPMADVVAKGGIGSLRAPCGACMNTPATGKPTSRTRRQRFLLPAYPAINQLGLFAVFSLDAWSSRKTKHSLTYRTLLVRVTDSAFHLNSSKLPPAGRKMRGRGTS